MRKAFTPLEILNTQKNRIKFLMGFTLIEILFVVIILTILVGVAIPSIKNTYSTLELNNFAGQLQAYMNYLSSQSVISGEAICLNIDNDNRQYWSAVMDSESKLKTVHIPESIKLVTDKKQIVFYPDGSIDTVTITASNLSNQYVNLTTKGVFGSVKMQSGK